MAIISWPDAWGPLREMQRLSRTLDSFLERGMAGVPAWMAASEHPPVNIYATPDDIIVSFEIPGVKPATVDLSVTADTLTIKGERKTEANAETARHHRRERRMGEFVRSLNLPERVQTDGVEARYVNGLLIVRLPKAEEAKARKIQVAGEK